MSRTPVGGPAPRLKLSEKIHDGSKRHRRDDWVAHAEELENTIERLRLVLHTIGVWDMLNPPQTDRVADLAWLRELVDDALAPTDDRTSSEGGGAARMTTTDKLREAMDVLAWRASKSGSDTCGCDDCAKKRAKQRAKAVTLLAGALKDLGA